MLCLRSLSSGAARRWCASEVRLQAHASQNIGLLPASEGVLWLEGFGLLTMWHDCLAQIARQRPTSELSQSYRSRSTPSSSSSSSASRGAPGPPHDRIVVRGPPTSQFANANIRTSNAFAALAKGDVDVMAAAVDALAYRFGRLAVDAIAREAEEDTAWGERDGQRPRRRNPTRNSTMTTMTTMMRMVRMPPT